MICLSDCPSVCGLTLFKLCCAEENAEIENVFQVDWLAYSFLNFIVWFIRGENLWKYTEMQDDCREGKEKKKIPKNKITKCHCQKSLHNYDPLALQMSFKLTCTATKCMSMWVTEKHIWINYLVEGHKWAGVFLAFVLSVKSIFTWAWIFTHTRMRTRTVQFHFHLHVWRAEWQPRWPKVHFATLPYVEPSAWVTPYRRDVRMDGEGPHLGHAISSSGQCHWFTLQLGPIIGSH